MSAGIICPGLKSGAATSHSETVKRPAIAAGPTPNRSFRVLSLFELVQVRALLAHQKGSHLKAKVTTPHKITIVSVFTECS